VSDDYNGWKPGDEIEFKEYAAGPSYNKAPNGKLRPSHKWIVGKINRLSRTGNIIAAYITPSNGGEERVACVANCCAEDWRRPKPKGVTCVGKNCPEPHNPWGEPNQPDGSYRCYVCRQGIKR
jgi:hypothetical protein